MKPGHVVLLGEMHGTNESPQFLSDALCVALQNDHSVTVGLELPFSETERADVFLESSGDAEAEQRLLKGNFGEKRLLIEVFLKAKKPPERYRPGGFSGERY